MRSVVLFAAFAALLLVGSAQAVVLTFDSAAVPVMSVDNSSGGTPVLTWNGSGYYDFLGGAGEWDGVGWDYAYGDVLGKNFTADVKGNFTGDANLQGLAVVVSRIDPDGNYQAWISKPGAFDLHNLADWTTVTLAIAPSNFDGWFGSFDTVFGDVQNIYLYETGSNISFDNVGFTPEPMTLTLLAMGGLLIARRRRA